MGAVFNPIRSALFVLFMAVTVVPWALAVLLVSIFVPGTWAHSPASCALSRAAPLPVRTRCGSQVHDDLAAFAEYMVRRERAERSASGETDSGFGRLD